VSQVQDAIEHFPLLGEVGQPGYLIVSLGELERSRPLMNLDFAQRESLQRDWQAGLRFLEAHRDFLRGALAAYRRRGWLSRMILALRAYLNEQPLVGLLLLVGLIALGTALWRSILAE